MMALPVFALLMVAEATVTSLRGHNVYALKDFGGSMSQLGINILVRLAIGGALIGLHFWLYQFRVFEVAAGPLGLAVDLRRDRFCFLLVSPSATPGPLFVVCSRGAPLQRIHESRYCAATIAHRTVY